MKSIKPDRYPSYPMDPITAVLRTRPHVLPGILRAFGWSYRCGAGGWGAWTLSLTTPPGSGTTYKLAILDQKTYHWRLCPRGAKGRRGWLGELLKVSLQVVGYPRAARPQRLAYLIQRCTGDWPELEKACFEEGERLRRMDEIMNAPVPRPQPPEPAPLLLDCHGWPDEPGSAANVTPFLRRWHGPRGDGVA